MRLRTVLMGLTALTFGGSAAFAVYLLGSPSKTSGSETATIVVVSADVPRGTSLTLELVQLKPWPKGHLPTGAITRIEDAAGRTVWIPLVPGEPVLEAKLAAKGAGRGMASLIPRGMRAVTIQTPNVSTGVAGFALPGNKVDVLLTLSHPGPDHPTGGGGTVTLLQNVEILAVDQRIEAPSENMIDPKELRSVTLLVSPQDAAKLDLGQNKGTLSLALRNPEDSDTDAIRSATLAELRDGRVEADADPESPEGSFAAIVGDAEPPAAEAAKPPREPDHSAPPVETLPTTAAAKPNVSVTRIRTLRGNSGGVVYLRRGVPTDDRVAGPDGRGAGGSDQDLARNR